MHPNYEKVLESLKALGGKDIEPMEVVEHLARTGNSNLASLSVNLLYKMGILNMIKYDGKSNTYSVITP